MGGCDFPHKPRRHLYPGAVTAVAVVPLPFLHISPISLDFFFLSRRRISGRVVGLSGATQGSRYHNWRWGRLALSGKIVRKGIQDPSPRAIIQVQVGLEHAFPSAEKGLATWVYIENLQPGENAKKVRYGEGVCLIWVFEAGFGPGWAALLCAIKGYFRNCVNMRLKMPVRERETKGKKKEKRKGKRKKRTLPYFSLSLSHLFSFLFLAPLSYRDSHRIKGS